MLVDDAALSRAREHLAQTGFESGSYDILQGEADIGRIDVTGEAHGVAGSVKRWLQGVMSDDADHARRYGEHLREGHVVLGVAVGKDETAKRRAADALGGAGATSIIFYAENYVEELNPEG